MPFSDGAPTAATRQPCAAWPRRRKRAIMTRAEEPLDDLSPRAMDSLELGVVQLDSAGVVSVWNTAQEALSGVPASVALGRNFFRDLTPSANRPAFYGRFLEGVRSGRLDERFRFTFSTGPRQVHAAVRMTDARDPGRH